MNLKSIQLIIIIFFISIKCQCSNGYTKGDTMYTWAEPYLNIRSEKSIDSEIISQINYGEKVVVLESKNISNFSKQEFTTNPFAFSKRDFESKFELHGSWVKIKYNDFEGYIMDVYISKLPTIVSSKDNSSNKSLDFIKYLERIDKIISYQKINTLESDGMFVEKWISSSGIIYTRKLSEGSSDEEIIFSGIDLEEGFLFLKRYNNLIASLMGRIESEELVTISNNQINAILEGSYFSFTHAGQSVIINIYQRD